MKSREINARGVGYTIQLDGKTIITPRIGYNESFNVRQDTRGDRYRANPHEFVKYSRFGLYGTQVTSTIPSSYNNGTTTGYLSDANQYPTISFSSESTRLYNECVSKLNDLYRGGLDHSVNAFQLSQTKSMFRSAFKVVELARSLRKMPARTIGGKWLELQYGWKPLLQDVYDTFEQLMDFGMNDPVQYKVRAKGTSKLGSLAPGRIFREAYTFDTRAEMAVWLLPPASATQKLAKYTSLNPASIGWELLPYSFVVDWFYDIGGYLRNLETALIYESRFVRGYYTYTERLAGIAMAFESRPPVKGQAGNFIDASADVFYAYKKRTVLSSYPLPRPPVLNTHLGSGRLMNAAALLSQFLRR